MGIMDGLQDGSADGTLVGGAHVSLDQMYMLSYLHPVPTVISLHTSAWVHRRAPTPLHLDSQVAYDTVSQSESHSELTGEQHRHPATSVEEPSSQVIFGPPESEAAAGMPKHAEPSLEPFPSTIE